MNTYKDQFTAWKPNTYIFEHHSISAKVIASSILKCEDDLEVGTVVKQLTAIKAVDTAIYSMIMKG